MEVTTGRKQKPKTNRAGDVYKPAGYDACQTPDYAIDPVLWYIKQSWKVWEPAAGEGLMVNKLESAGLEVVASDILTGQNFFEWQPESWDFLITNPPFSIKYKWLRHCCELDKPFAVLVPVETIGAAKGQALFEEFDGLNLMFMSHRANFKMPILGWDGDGAQFPTMWVCRWLWEGSNNFKIVKTYPPKKTRRPRKIQEKAVEI